jgi:hypothetical protein
MTTRPSCWVRISANTGPTVWWPAARRRGRVPPENTTLRAGQVVLPPPRREGLGFDGLPRNEHAGLLATRVATLITGELAGRGVRAGLRDRYRADG